MGEILKLKKKVVIADIEGTTTSIRFVKDVLFPYSYCHAYEYLKNNWDNPIVQEIIKDIVKVREYNQKFFDAPEITDFNKTNDVENNAKIISDVIKYFIQNDYKISPIKQIQGLMWEAGYRENKFNGHVYSDVPIAFEKWSSQGIQIYIYSSGSVRAQKLLFGNTEYGDLLKYIKGHFDTQIGYKQEMISYENILETFDKNIKPSDVVFFTDVPYEAYAARDAGIDAVFLRRPENAELSENDRESFPSIESFLQVSFE